MSGDREQLVDGWQRQCADMLEVREVEQGRMETTAVLQNGP